MGSFQELVFKEMPFKEQIPTTIITVKDTSCRMLTVKFYSKIFVSKVWNLLCVPFFLRNFLVLEK